MRPRRHGDGEYDGVEGVLCSYFDGEESQNEDSRDAQFGVTATEMKSVRRAFIR